MPELAENADIVDEAGKCESELGLSRVRAAAYRRIIERYADAIRQGETKTVPQLKELILPHDASIEKAVDKLFNDLGRGTTTEGMVDFSFDRDFLDYAKTSLKFVQSLSMIHSEVGVPFWMTPKDIIEIGAADSFDRALFYCSLLVSAGCADARVRVVALDGGERHPLVVFPFGNRFFAADPCEKQPLLEGENLEPLLQELSIDGKRFIRSVFEFNNEDYEEFD
ncbi:hypothetical protein AUJ14_04650 [Candidatus Micrarchaeota archaeon CG1_02_55_22]|nr:MAG: hypothetical protein AUJ14_04650 [Candidatus Micrarchaeota archaeon CG1_02_55_22]